MGWNDTRSMVAILLFAIQRGHKNLISSKLLKSIFMIFLVFGLQFTCFATQQDENVNSNLPKEQQAQSLPIKIHLSYPLNIIRVYKMIETTEVQRTYSDSTKKEYKREATFYISEKNFDLPKTGFITLQVSADSLQYKFIEGEAVFEFDTQKDKLSPIKFKDLTVTAVPLGRPFNMTYSPYGEVANIEGEDLQWLKDFIEDQGKDMPDDFEKTIWLDGISMGRLSHLADLRKITYPSDIINIDSIWTSNFAIQLNGIQFTDTALAKVAEFNAGYTLLQAKVDNMMPVNKGYYFYGVTKLVSVMDGNGKGSYNIKINPRGVIDNISAEFQSNITGKVSGEVFNEKISTKITWELLEQYIGN